MFALLNLFIENFFLSGAVPANAESGNYFPFLVALSYVIAVLGSFTALRFATDIRDAGSRKAKNLLHWGGSFAFGTGIWSMHFIGMLAYKMDMAIAYDPFLTIVSMIVAVVIAYGVLAIIRSTRLSLPWMIIGGFLLGSAICAMHYTGMAAMQMDADLRYIPSLFGLSYVIAVTASLAALFIVFVLGRTEEGGTKLFWQIIAAMVMGLAICGMHYTGMAAAVFIPWADCRYNPMQSFHTLAMSVAVISSAVFAVALTLSMYKSGGEGDEDTASGNKVFLQLALLLSVFLVLLAGSFMFINSDGRRYQDKVVNAAGLQRMLMTRYVYDVYQVMLAQDDEAEEKVVAGMHEDRKSIDTNYQSFLQGGSLVISADGARELIPERFLPEGVKGQVTIARQKWRDLHGIVTGIIADERDDFDSIYYRDMQAALATAVRSQDNVIRSMQHSFWQGERKSAFRQEMVLAAGFLTFVLTLIYARYFIVQPIVQSRQILESHRENLQRLVEEQTKNIAQARDKLREEKTYLTAIMDNMMQALITIDKSGKIQTFNKWAEHIFDYKAADVAGQNVNILMPEPHKSRHDSYISHYLKTGQAKIIGKTDRQDVFGTRADGETFPISLSVTEVAVNGHPVFIGLISDISEQQQREANLRAARDEAKDAHARLKKETKTIKLLERITNAINESGDMDAAIKICLEEICGFTGWPAGHAYLVDEPHQRLVPSKIWHLQNPQQFQSLQKATETTVLSASVGLPGRVYAERESVWISNILEDENFPRSRHIEDIPVQAGFGFPVLVKKDVVAVLEFFAGKLEKPSEDFMSMMASIGTQLGRVIERDKIEKARADAEKANQAKSEFLASMSHELRTPLNSIMGLTQMLVEDPSLKEDERNMAGTAHKSANNLLEIVNDILDISKIEAGNIVLEKTGFDFKNLVATVMEAMMPIASSKGISLNYSFVKDDIPYLFGDALRVSRVLTNLVGNAVKYTDQGQVDVTINMHPLSGNGKETDKKESPGVEIYCEVKDTGIGIAKENLALIFDKFTQADASISRKYGGTGLGLAITKELVELMGGRIGVDSKIGKGSVFWIKIPFPTAEKEESDQQKQQRRARRKKNGKSRIPIEKAHVLVAEDHLLNQDLLKRLLPRMGFGAFDMVENGQQAIDRFAEEAYDLILMDCHMPEKNGYEATAEIRKQEGKKKKPVPIIALTADAMKGTREKCLEAGMNDYLSKPIDKDELRDVLEEWFIFPDQAVLPEKKGDKKSKRAVIELSLIKEYADTPEEIREFAEMFIAQSLESLTVLKENTKAGENTLWVEVAHKLKGGAGMWGAETLRLLCEKAQNMNPATAKERKALYTKIEKEYQRVEKELKKLMADA
ncbi:MAG: response regulator [Alphaproteobacteria bacterium]|nr:MAG: response regulator [Alphaproteobacteria bacterium]